MQIIIVILGAILGLSFGANFEGFIFTQKICLFAGLTLILPSLFNVKLQDITLLWPHKIVVVKSLLLNFILLPLFAVGIALLSQDFGVGAGVFLLSVLSGGGMVMHWIKKSGADTSLGFLLLFMNLTLVTLSLLMLHTYGMYSAEYFGVTYSDEASVSNFARGVIMLLIVIPFLVSRVVLFVKPLVKLITSYRSYISNISIFMILFYLFGLQNSQQLFELYDFEPELIGVSVVAVSAFYMLSVGASFLIFNLDSPQERAAFWHSVTRYITLALVISTFTTNTFGISMLLPIMMAYLVQIPVSIMIEKWLVKRDVEKVS